MKLTENATESVKDLNPAALAKTIANSFKKNIPKEEQINDELFYFFKSVENKVRKLSPVSQAEVRFSIEKLLYEIQKNKRTKLQCVFDE